VLDRRGISLALFLNLSHGLLALGCGREPPRIGFGLLLAFAILLRQAVRWHGLAILLDEATEAILTRQPGIDFEDLDRLALNPARSVQPLPGPPFDKGVAALPSLVRLQPFL